MMRYNDIMYVNSRRMAMQGNVVKAVGSRIWTEMKYVCSLNVNFYCKLHRNY
jgi:hypothetical protein